MKLDWLITFRSITAAQKGERLLKKAGIDCTMQRNEIFCGLQRTPKQLSERGCGYCLRVRAEQGMAAVGLLREQQLPYGKVYRLDHSSMPQELEL